MASAAPILVSLDGLDGEEAHGLSEEAVSFLDIMRREVRELQLRTAKSEAELKETRHSFGSTIQKCMEQGMAHLHTVKSCSEHGQQDQSMRLAEALARLEQQQLSCQREAETQLRTLQRDMIFGFDGEKRERELALSKLESSLAQCRQQKVHALASEKDSANSLDSKMQVQSSIDSMDQRLRADMNQQYSLIQDQIRQHCGSIRERLSKHDEFRADLQASLERTNRELRAELSRASDDQKVANAQLRDVVHTYKAASDKQAVDQRGAIEQSKTFFREALQDLDKELRKEVSRQLASQQSILSTQRDQLDSREGRLVSDQAAKPALEALDQRLRETAQSLNGLRDRVEQQRDAATLRAGERDQLCAGLQTSLDGLGRELQAERGHVQHVADEQKAVLEKLSSVQAAHATQVAAHDDARSDFQASMLELERQFWSESTRLGTEQQAARTELGSILGEHKLEIDRRLAADKVWRDEQRNSLVESTEAVEKALRKELQRLAADAGESQAAVREALDRQKVAAEKQLAAERSTQEEAREAVAKQCRDSERALRKELGQLAEDQLGTLSKFRDLLSESKAESKGAVQAALEELDGRVKRDIARAAGEQSKAHTRLLEQLEEQRATLDQHLTSQVHRNAREDRPTTGPDEGLQSDVGRQLRKEIGQLAAERSTQEEAREAVAKQCRDSERALRKELGQLAEDQLGILSKFRDLLSESKAESKGTVQAALEELDGRVKRDIARAAGEQSKAHTRLVEQLEEQRATFDQHVTSQAHRHAREASPDEQPLQPDAERQLRTWIGQLRDVITDLRKEQEKALAEERAARSEQHCALFESTSASEQQARREAARAIEASAGVGAEVEELRRQFDEHRARAALSTSVEALDHSLRNEISSQKSEQQYTLKKASTDSHRALAAMSGRQAQVEQALEEQRASIDKQLSAHQDLLRAALQQEMPQRNYHQAPVGHSALEERVVVVEQLVADSGQLLSALSNRQQAELVSQQELHLQQMSSLEKHVTTRNESLKELIQKEKLERGKDRIALQERLFAVENRADSAVIAVNAVNAVTAAAAAEQKQQAPVGLPGVVSRSPTLQSEIRSRELCSAEPTRSRRLLGEATSITSRPPPDSAPSMVRPPRPLDGTPVSTHRPEELPFATSATTRGDSTPVVIPQRQQSPYVRFPQSLAGSFAAPVDRHDRPAAQDRAEVLVTEQRRPTMTEQIWQAELRPHNGSETVDEFYVVGDAHLSTQLRTSTVAGDGTPGGMRTSTAVMPGSLIAGPPSLYARTSTPSRLGASPLRARG